MDTVLRTKICLIGDSGVGKTSLVKRYVSDYFEESYARTLGTKVCNVELSLTVSSFDSEVKLVMNLWDIMGQLAFRELLQEAFFHGARGILAVCDATDPGSLQNLDGWIDAALRIAGDVPVRVLVNKFDLRDNIRISEQDLTGFCGAFDSRYTYVSAKTGDNVRGAFEDIAKAVVEKAFGSEEAGGLREDILFVD